MPQKQLSRLDRANQQRKARRAKLIKAAHALARKVGYRHIMRADVADRVGMAHSIINHEFGTMDGLRDAVVEYAVRRGYTTVLAQALAAGHPIAKRAPAELRARAISSLG